MKLNTLITSHWQPFWSSRQPRERKLLIGLGVFLAVAVGYAGIWQPTRAAALKNRTKFAALQQQVALASSLSDEAAKLKRQPALTPLNASALLDLLKQSSAATGLTEGQWNSDGEHAVTFSGTVPFDAWLRWAGELAATQQVRLVSLKAETSGQAGSAKLTARFVHAGAPA